MRVLFFASAFLIGAPALAASPDHLGVSFNDDLLLGELERGTVTDPDDTRRNRRARNAEPEDEPMDELDLLEEDLFQDLEPEPPRGTVLRDFSFDDDLFDAPPARQQPAAPASRLPGPVDLEVAGLEPLADNYPITVVAVDRDAVVVELPVLVARSRVAIEEPFLLIAEVFVGDERVSGVRQEVHRASAAEFGPTFAFLKVLAPVVERQGEIRVVVKQAALDGSGATELFSRVTPYTLR